MASSIGVKMLVAGGSVVCFLILMMTEVHRSTPKEKIVFSKNMHQVHFPTPERGTKNVSQTKQWKNFYRVSNAEEIDKIVKEEIRELTKLGVKLDIAVDAEASIDVTTEESVIEPTINETVGTTTTLKSTRVTSSMNITHNPSFVAIRTPEPADLEKIQQDQLSLEHATDPLPESTYCQRDVFLLILVISQPSSFKRRDNIRDSWAFSYEDDYTKLKKRKDFPNEKTYLPKDVVKTVFVVGQAKDDSDVMEKVREEAYLTKDIIFGDLVENYRNLTLKTKLALKWAAYGCKSTFVIKTDDDVFINPVVLVEWLKGVPQENFYSGWCNFNSPVVRTKDHKWYVSFDDYKENRFPGYCLGGGYLMSEDLVLKVVKKSYGRKIFPMEDLYVGLMVKELGVQPRDEKSHFNLVYSGKTVNECYLNNLFLAHQVLDNNLMEHIKMARSALEKC